MSYFLRGLVCALAVTAAVHGQTILQGSTSDMRGNACTPSSGSTVAMAVYLQAAPGFGYVAQLRFCDPKSKLWFPLPLASNVMNGEELTVFTGTQYPNRAAALSRTPVAVNLVTRNGLALKAGVDYSFAGNVITFLTPIDDSDSLQAWYSY
jgi:hypothetical protein